jgi:glycosyltransferase involved in cell wall biosynthesis
VSVVIAVFDGERFLAEAIASATAQTYSPLEVIVVDDGSRDRSAQLATRCGARVLRRPHRGVSAARNAGIAAARGDVIAFLDADDRWPVERLALQVEHFIRRPELGFVLGRARLFLHPSAPRPAWYTDDLAEHESVLARLTLVARRELFDRVGGFDESIDICEDFDWLVRCREAGIPYEVLDDVVLEYRVHDGNTGLSRRSDLERGLLCTLRSSIQRRRAADSPR